MSKRKYDWCYFADGNKKKITNWYKSGEDILFFIDGEIYLYKKYRFELELEEEALCASTQNVLYRMIPRHGFYIHRYPTLDYSPDCYNKDKDDEWIATNIEKIELRIF